MGQRSPCLWVLILVVLVGFDSCGSCGGDWCLWWKKMLVEGGDLTVRKGRRRSLP